MSNLFDLISGTSSGAILAAALSVESLDSNISGSYYAEDVINKFIEHGPLMYPRTFANIGLQWIITSVCIFIGGFIGYRIGKCLYANPLIEEQMQVLQMEIRELKKCIQQTERFSMNPLINMDESSSSFKQDLFNEILI